MGEEVSNTKEIGMWFFDEEEYGTMGIDSWDGV
jgi:hypothetical protein